MNSILLASLAFALSVTFGFGAGIILSKTNRIKSKMMRLLLWMTGGLVGFISCVLLLNYDFLEFDGTLTAGNVVQSSATLLVGLLVASYFQRHTQADRKEKDILLKHLDLILDALEELEQFKEGGVLTKITASLKKLSVQCRAVHQLICYLEYPKEIIVEVSFDEQIKKLRKLATETPIKKIKAHANSTRCSSIVRNGIIELAQEKAALLDAEMQQMKASILKSQIHINRV